MSKTSPTSFKKAPAKVFTVASRTLQSEVPMTDLNGLLHRYREAQNFPERSGNSYGDVSDYPKDKLEALLAAAEQTQNAVEAFKSLPMDIRIACGHDPRNLDLWLQAHPGAFDAYSKTEEPVPAEPSEDATGRTPS